MSRVVYIREKAPNQQHGGNKGVEDINTVLGKKYDEISELYTLPGRRHLFDYARFFTRNWSNLNTIRKSVKNDDILIIQYPHYNFHALGEKLIDLFRIKNTILLVHDVDSVRYQTGIDEEIKLLNLAKVVLLHNQKMSDYLVKHGLKTKTVNINIFDYLLYNTPSQESFSFGKQIVFAGNLGKSHFLNLMGQDSLGLSLSLFGPGLSEEMKESSHVHWMGSYSPDEIPFKLKGSFGLVWDGTSLDECDGFMGRYMKINFPHKLALYIAAGIPVVTWSQAAIADIVKTYKIGFVVDSLREVSNYIDSINEKEYAEYKKNILKLQKKVMSGYFTALAFEKAVTMISR
ncbi:hypothetical protein GCWU000321_01511 [Dialister invisus DSM 15470]|jgi:uncharacterized ubiquitin-like protein YukD|uniref:Galactofuranosyltransferase n=1 Tax=Dialister invisus DSM 15470 TaxID=592028 RepID=C9LPN1_9FIRM|nr:hypothetical protein [Dialister invisus]EEW97517.1 hypothetical protein GCWU000321_01511 [Dialister invisus DSM 15470]